MSTSPSAPPSHGVEVASPPSPPPEATWGRVLRLTVLVASYVALALIALGATSSGGWARLGSRYVGGGEIEGWLWRYWWFKQVLAGAWSTVGLDLATRLRFTLEASLYPDFGNLVDLVTMSIPMEAVLGSPLYYNVKIVVILALNGVGAYALARGLGARPWAAWVAGAVFAINPYFLFEIASGRVRQAIGFACPLYLLYLWRSWTQGGTRNMLLAGTWLGIASWLYYYYGMWLVFFNVLFLAWWLIWGRSRPHSATFARDLVLVHILALLVVLPSVQPYVALVRSGDELHETSYRTDVPSLEKLLSTPPGRPDPGQGPLYSMHRFIFMSLSVEYAYRVDSQRAIPLVYTVLALVPLLFLRPRPWLWVLTFLFFYTLSLGPYLKAGGANEYFVGYPPGIRLPYVYFFKYVPVFSRLFSPIRLSVMVFLAVGCMAALHLTRLLPRDGRLAGVLSILVVALGVGQMQWAGIIPLRTVDLQPPAYYGMLPLEPHQGLIELPIKAGDYTDFLQTVHGRKVLMSWADAGLPRGFPDGPAQHLADPRRVDDNAFVDFIEALNRDPAHPRAFTRESVVAMRRLGYRYVILHERGCSIVAPRRPAWQFDQMRLVLQHYLGGPFLDSREVVPMSPRSERGDESEYARVAVFTLEPAVDPAVPYAPPLVPQRDDDGMPPGPPPGPGGAPPPGPAGAPAPL